MYILVQTSHELLEQLSEYLTITVNAYPDSKRQDSFQPYGRIVRVKINCLMRSL